MTRMERLSTLTLGYYGVVSAEPNADLSHYFDYFRRLDFGSVYPLLLAFTKITLTDSLRWLSSRQHGLLLSFIFAAWSWGALEFTFRPLHRALQIEAGDGNAVRVAVKPTRERE